MVSPCSGISTKVNTSTPLKLVTSLTLSSSHQTVTGYALLPHHASRSSILNQNLSLMNSNQTLLTLAQTQKNQKLFLSLGQLMVKPYSLVSLTTTSVSGPSLKFHLIFRKGIGLFVKLLRNTHSYLPFQYFV